jgi:hypothetical protein
MRKIYLFMLTCTLALPAFSQKAYYYGINSTPHDVVLEGKQTKCFVITGVECLSPAHGEILPFDLITAIDGAPVTDNFTKVLQSKPRVALSVKRLGNQTLDVSLAGVPVDVDYFVSEADYARFDVGGQVAFYITEEAMGNAIEIISDPEANLYGYSTFDFEFIDNNILQQKEIAPEIEVWLTNKGLKRDRENPEMLIFIEFFSDRREQYIPPSQQTSTRYGTHYNVYTKKWESRQYIESRETGNYSQVEYLTKLAITMADVKSMKAGNSGSSVIWQASYETQLSGKANHKDFAKSIGFVMLTGYPSKSVRYVNLCPYWFTGILYDAIIQGKVAGVVPDSPAAKAGIKAGEVIQKSSAYNNRIFKVSFSSLMRIKDVGLGEAVDYTGFNSSRFAEFKRHAPRYSKHSPFSLTYMTCRFYNDWDKKQTITYDKKPLVFTVKGSNGKTREVSVRPTQLDYVNYVLQDNSF